MGTVGLIQPYFPRVLAMNKKARNWMKAGEIEPIGSMYGRFTYIYHDLSIYIPWPCFWWILLVEEARCCLWSSQVLLGEKYMSSSHFSWWWHDWAGSDFHYAAADDYTRTFEHSQSNQPTFFLRVEKLATNFLRLPKVVLKISDMAQIPGKKQGNEHDSQSGTPNWFSKTSCLAENDELKSFINYPVRLVRDRLILLMVQKSFTSW